MRGLLVLVLSAQLLFAWLQPRPAASLEAFPPPPTAAALRGLSFGEPVALAQLLGLYVQSFDVQSGVAFSLAQLDYARVETWLSRLIELDPKSDYALLLATHVYAQVNDPLRSRQMLDFAYRHYREDPARRWRWIAHASIMARHRLHDLPLALHYARALALAPDTARIPAWAQQMQVFLHEALGESEAALALLGGLLDTGRVQDPHEIHFLMEQAERLRSAERSTSTSAGIDLARASD
ncbi:MAG TPA: hypothetical protein VFB54_16125 [Burkholderiales bacterium]|nr:hypothetical protein [Burkholderiales bacterium]